MKFVYTEEVRVTLEALWVKSGVYYSQDRLDKTKEVWGKVIVCTEYNTHDHTVIRQWVSGILDDEYFTVHTLEQMALDGQFVITNKFGGPTVFIKQHGGLEQAIDAWNNGRVPEAQVYWNLELVDIDVWKRNSFTTLCDVCH